MMEFSLFAASRFPPVWTPHKPRDEDNIARAVYARQKLLVEIRARRRKTTKRKGRCGKPKHLCRCHRPERGWWWFIVAMVAVVAAGLTFKKPVSQYDACVDLHQRGLLNEALAACRAAADARAPNAAEVRNTLGLVLYDLGRLSDAVTVHASAADADPHNFELTHAAFRLAALVTDLLVNRLVPLGLDKGFLNVVLSPQGKTRLTLQPSDTYLETSLVPPAIETCYKFRPCRAALDHAVKTRFLHQRPLGASFLGADAKTALRDDFNYILDVLRRRGGGSRYEASTPLLPPVLIEAMAHKFLAVLE